ncbi:hypothetical protein LUZ60_002066 [Juncus effusus]|nr:hypothetical protein LUZ60_002066 [Juncus effusus]
MEGRDIQEESSKSRKTKRGRVELTRIEDRTSRQVRFSKRRSGLFKKAFELAVLCDVEVALLVFSPAGRLFEFSSCSCIEKTFKRYQQFAHPQKHTSSNRDLNIDINKIPNDETEVSFSDFSSQIQEVAQWSTDANIDQLEAKELEELEKLLLDVLARTKSRKKVMKEREEKSSVIISEMAFEEGEMQ